MAMAEYMFQEDVPELQQVMAKYYAAGTSAAADLAGSTIAMPRRDMHPDLAAKLGIDPNRNMRVDEVANLMAGNRADGAPIEGRANWKSTESKTRLSYVDLTFSAPKSLSVAIVFAETPAERAVLDSAHTTAVERTLEVIMKEIGVASKGKAACDGYEAGEMAYVRFEHFTARPVAKVARVENGVAETDLVTVRGIVGDPQRHTHAILPLVVLTPTGRVGSPPLDRMKDRVKEWGSLYHAFLATELRSAGVDVRLDPKTGAAYLSAIPRWVCEMFSKRNIEIDRVAREFASTRGLDWDKLSTDSQINLLRTGSMSSRNSKPDGVTDFAVWLAEALDRGYVHKRVLYPERARQVPQESVQVTTAYDAARPMLSEEFYKRAKLEGHVLRTMAARGLIESGINSAADIDKVTAAFRERGVDHEGHRVLLLWAKESGERYASVTTGLHIEQENEAIGLLQTAAADRSSDLSSQAIQAAVDRFLTDNPHITLDTEHGKLQRAMIERLGRSGRAAMGVGSAGSGKTTLLSPLVDAWRTQNREVYGVTLAWRQTTALADAGIGRQIKVRRGLLAPDTDQLERSGIAKERTMAMARFLKLAGEKKIPLGKGSVVVVDEAATIGTRQLLLLARLRAEHGFQLVALGDDKQVQSIEHGNSVRLFRKALGAEQVPEIATTVRQDSERDRVTAGLFRDGRADEALARKVEDGTLVLVPGNEGHAIKAAVDLWEQRQRENAGDPKYRIGISVPTNDAVRAVGEEVRRRRRATGEVGPDITTMPAQDQLGGTYALPLAKGDRVRLFARAYAVGGGMFGENGTVAEVESMDAVGLTMRRMDNGRSATVKWETLRDPETQRVRLTYGDALTVDTRQGDTLTEHILLMPAGSQAVNGFKGYSGESRHRKRSWIVTSQGAEMQEVVGRRALGDPRPVTDEDLIANMGRNLSRQPEKVLATDFLERAESFRRGTVRNMQAADYGRERREADGKPATNAGERRTEREEQAAAETVAAAVQRLAAPLKRLTYEEHDANRARRTMKRPAERPKAPQQPRKEAPVSRKPISEVEAMGEFADALTRAGFRLRGAPIMDGKIHRAQVDGDRGVKKSGSYVGYLDGTPAGYIHNYKTGEEIRWKASSTTKPLPDAERARLTAQMEATRQARETERRAAEEATARMAERVWARGTPVVSHPYLTRKDVGAHGIRQDNRGRLLVPMRDAAGKLWNVQTINAEGTKLFMKGRKQGTFAVLGEMRPGAPIAVAEGYATAATIREVTGLATVAAFDSGNLMEVAKALRGADVSRPIVFAADNDHHAPRREKPLPNVGMEKAQAAAAAVGGVVLLPAFEPTDRGTDWNDVAAALGKRAVREMVAAELGQHGIALPVRGATVSQAARDAARERMQTPSSADVAARAAAEAARTVQRAKGPTA